LQNLLGELTKLLSTEETFIVEGQLNKDLVVQSALNLDTKLLKLLIQNTNIKKHFFKGVNGILIFDKVKFQTFVQNKDFLPDSFTQYKIKIGLATRDHYIKDDDRIVLNWPYKDCLLEGGQDTEDAKRQEVFWNQNLAPDEISRLLKPKVLTGFERFGSKDKGGARINLSGNNNLVFKGNNLIALHSILPRFGSKVDVIYIDPPYYFEENKNSDTFAYNSNFKLSTWLTFMMNRLEIARQLLSKKGVIFISTNDEGVYYLKLLCDEIFGIEKYITNFIWKKRSGGGNDSEGVAMDHEYILCYGNISALRKLEFNEEQLKKYRFKDSKFATHGPYSLKNLHDSSLQDSKGLHHDIECPDGTVLKGVDYQWKCNKETFEERKADDRIVFSKDKNGKWRVEYKIYLYENKGRLLYDENGKVIQKGIIPNATLDGIASNSEGTRELKLLFPDEKRVFNYPKPIKLIKHLLKMIENKDALILDFFAGSGTTGHAAMELNSEDGGHRNFILIEQMDYVSSLTSERIDRAIAKFSFKESFVYAELKELNAVFISRLQKCSSKKELRAIWREILESAFISYQAIDRKRISFDDLAQFNVDEIRTFMLEMIDQNHLYVPITEIDDESFMVDAKDKELNKDFYGDLIHG